MKDKMPAILIAPCGMNCSLCGGYLAMKNDVRTRGVRLPYCTGCRIRNKQCAFLKGRCQNKKMPRNEIKFCFECRYFPCPPLVAIDNRYQLRYRMSLIENLEFIKKNGLKKFLAKEQKKWQCPKCGGIICCHNGVCFSCGLARLKRKKKLYRWD